MYAKVVDELLIYQLAFQLAIDVGGLVKSVSNYWENDDVRQIKRSSSSVSSNIAEGFGNRFYARQYIHYLIIAKGSADETKNHIKKLQNDKYIKPEIANNYVKRYTDLSVRTLNFINYLKKKHNIRL